MFNTLVASTGLGALLIYIEAKKSKRAKSLGHKILFLTK
jgi:hypothetical protein